MNVRWAVPIVILAAVLLPLPFAIVLVVFGVLLAVRPRGGPAPVPAAVSRPADPILLRGPPR